MNSKLQREKQKLKKKLGIDLDRFLLEKKPLQFQINKQSKVSIVIALWNQAELTLACLKSLLSSSYTQYEIIIIDNASTDATQALLSNTLGIRVISNQENVGFLKAINQGASVATGEFLLILNNDAIIDIDAILYAVKKIESDGSIGAVGGKIILPSGMLQEAGSIIWKDGSCSGYLRGHDPYCNESMFEREVDYCSAVFLLTRLQLFKDLGGFNEAYAPSYYEETDYCVRLAQHDYRVIYSPKVLLTHYEFGSAVLTDTAFQQMEKNKTIFKQLQKAFLKHQYHHAHDNTLVARSSSRLKRVLIFDDTIPRISQGGGLPRAVSIANTLVAHGFFVTIYPLSCFKMGFDEAYKDISADIEVILNQGPRLVQAFLQSRQHYYDVILVSRPTWMKLLSGILFRLGFIGRVKIIYDAEAIWATREMLYQEKILGRSITEKQRQQCIEDELHLASIANAVLAVSSYEAHAFKLKGYDKVFTIGHKVEPKATTNPFSYRKHLLFVGRLSEKNTPNVHSIVWFINKVLPIVIQQLPEVDLLCVGVTNNMIKNQILNSCPKHLKEKIKLLGEQDCLETYLNNAKLFICPTQFSAGIPHKIHTAASAGLPIVSTHLIAEQLGWKHKEELLCADDPIGFAKHIITLYHNESLWLSLRTNAIKKITHEQSSALFDKALISAFDVETTDLNMPAFFTFINQEVKNITNLTNSCYAKVRNKLYSTFGLRG